MKYRCDIPMATKKKIRKYCNGKCDQCLCGIGMDKLGHEYHVADMTGGCGNIVTRNIEEMSERGKHEQQTKRQR